MKLSRHSLALLVLSMVLAGVLVAQETTQSSVTVPPLVNFSGKALDAENKPIAGIAGITFSIYKDQYEGVPLWMETQNVTADAAGNYTAQLGATKPQGLPLDLFGTGEARWLGVRINGGEEQPRVLLLSVPYALKAADAQTLGGLPASAFVLAAPPNVSSSPDATAASSSSTAVVQPALAGTGTTDFVPLWTPNGTTLGTSVLFQSGTGSTAKIGINNTSPASTLDVSGGTTVRGNLSLPATATATSSAGENSQPETFAASVYNSSTKAAVAQAFRWQAEPVSNDTASATGSLNLLYGSGASTPAETGLKISSKGVLSFATGQTFPGTGKGSVTSVALSAPTTDFTVSGSPVTASGTLALKWNIAPTSSDTADAIVKRDSTGSFTADNVNLTTLNVNATNNLAIIANATGGDAAILGGSDTNSGVAGSSVSGYGVSGIAVNADGIGVYGSNTAEDSIGLEGVDTTAESIGVVAVGPYALVSNGSTFAGEFIGNVEVEGSLSKDSGSFKIDHPLDPANKYLYHSFVESPDMMNIYNGNVTTDAEGNAVISLPEWFETLNRDFRYQLTVLGQFSQAIVSSKVANHQFSIKTDKPSVEVSWQVTGIRQDAWANAHRIPVEEMKPAKERGFYRHPELYNAPPEKSVGWARHPRAMKPAKAPNTAKPAQAAHSPLARALAPAKP
jgi:trimeric autotransporter adhesin